MGCTLPVTAKPSHAYATRTVDRWRVSRLVGFLLSAVALKAVDPSWNWAVQATASVSASPPQIELSWVEDTTGGRDGYRPGYTVKRKAANAAQWEVTHQIPAGQLGFRDLNVTSGVAYEYEIMRTFNDPAAPEVDHVAYAHLLSGIDVPFPDRRGRVIIAVESELAAALGARLQELRRDLLGDGWTSAVVTVSAGDSPSRVRDQIRAEYGRERADMLYLLGRIPVARAGNYRPDGHEMRSFGCDTFYGDMDGAWTDADGDGVFDTNVIMSDLELAVGRVDFSSLEKAQTGRSEAELTARYIEKAREYRNGRLRFPRRGLIADRVGIDRQRAPAAGGYRLFSAFYGPENIFTANTEDNAPDSERWYSRIRAEPYAWTFGTGAGSFDFVTTLGTEGQHKAATSAQLAADAKAGFYLMFGSYMIEWDRPGNVLRSALAAPQGGLGAAWSGRPHFLLHRMGLGEPVGLGVRLTHNNETLYFSPLNAFNRGIHVTWLGDPTLRLDYIGAPGDLTGSRADSALRLSWSASAEGNAARYFVYRAGSAEGPFTRVGETAPGVTVYTDNAPLRGGTYMVRAVALQQTQSGTYQNPSQGAFWTNTINFDEPEPRPEPHPQVAGDRLTNLSVRLRLAGNDANRAPAIGFVVWGTGEREILVRAVGPTLSVFGVSNPLPDPELRVLNSSGAVVATNAGWGNNASVDAAGDRVGAFGLQAGSRDAAVLIRVPPGAYTAQVRSGNTGTVLVEVYDAAAAGAARQLGNLSTRAPAEPDSDLVAGFVVGGVDQKRLLIRGVGPGIAPFGVSGVAPNPSLRVFNASGTLMAQNDRWGVPQSVPGGPGPASGGEIANAAANVGAFGLQANSEDAAIVATLPPGAYTAVVSAVGAGGVALVEVYDLGGP